MEEIARTRVPQTFAEIPGVVQTTHVELIADIPVPQLREATVEVAPPERLSQTVDVLAPQYHEATVKVAPNIAQERFVPDWEYPCAFTPRGNRESRAGHTCGHARPPAPGGNRERCTVHTTGARRARGADCGYLCASHHEKIVEVGQRQVTTSFMVEMPTHE